MARYEAVLGALWVEVQRRWAMRRRLCHLCPNRACRRWRRCAGAGLPCLESPQLTHDDKRQLNRYCERMRPRR